MNSRKFIFIILLLFSSLVAHSQNDDLIYWTEGTKLSWNDFIEVPPNDDYAARSSLSINYTICKRSIWNGKVSLKVDCTFQKSNSHVSKQDIHPLLLPHEQLHFDIAELFARKLRMEFANTKLNVDNVDAEAKRLHHKVFREYNTFQRLFDIDTQHGKEKEKQLNWELKVEKELKSLESYKNNNCSQV